MDNFTDERDLKALESDPYTFAVLRRILGGKCEFILTDHERLIICFSRHPYPVWIWTPDDATDEEMERAYELVAAHGMLDGGHRFNMKYPLADYFIKRAGREGKTMSLSMNMFAYDCLLPVRPSIAADGALDKCTLRDIETAMDFMTLFHEETGTDIRPREDYRADAEAHIKSGNMYLWRDAQGKAVACCKYAVNHHLASLSLVFTHPDFRRRHYAENMVWEVTQIATDAGYIPMLYTDADYVASNACYEKIGYVLRGKLCTIG